MCEVKSRIVTAKPAFKQEEGCYCQQVGLKVKEENVKFYIWGIAYGAEEEWSLVGLIVWEMRSVV